MTGVLGRLGEPLPHAQLIEISGEPGIGKTRLLQELARLARQRDLDPAFGHSTEYERNVPFGVFAEIFARVDHGPTPDEQHRAALSVVLTGAQSAPLPGSTGLERYRLHRVLRQTLVAAATAPGLLLVLDDLHWADEASLELLEHLLDEPHALLVVAVAYRTGQAPPKLAGALARTRMATTRIELDRLAEADVAGLMPGVAPQRVAALYTASGGNPLYLDAVSRLSDRTLVTLADPARTGTAQIPSSLQSLLEHEFAALGEPQRRVAHALAVAGEPAHLDLVAHIAGIGEDDLSLRIDELVAAGVVQDVGSGLAFRHPLVRAAAYQSAGPGWRIRAHRLAAGHLQEHGGPLSLRAHHCARAATYGDLAAVDTLVAAATAAVDSAPATASEWLRVALRLLPESDDMAARRVELLLGFSRALQLCGELAASREMLHDMLSRPACPRGPVVRLLAITERLLGRFDEAQARLEAELGPQRTVVDYYSGAHLAVLSSVHLLRNSLPTCGMLAGELIVAARRLADDNLLAVGHTLAGLAALHQGDIATARTELAGAVPLLDAFPDAQLREHLHLLAVLAWLEFNLERYDDAQRHLQRSVAIARNGGHSHALPYLFVMEAALATRVGRLDVALRCATDAAEMSRLIGSDENLAWTRGIELRTTLWQRGPEATLALVDVIRAEGGARSGWFAEVAEIFIATVHLAADDPAGCVTHVEETAASVLAAPTTLHTPQMLAGYAVAKARLGAHDEALDLVGRCREVARALGLAFPQGLAERAFAEVLVACGRPAEAVSAARSAVRHFRDAGAPVQEALSRETLAEALARTGDLDQARVELGTAKSAFTAAPAPWLAARATRAEAKLGARGSRGTGSDGPGVLGGLSVREAEVAGLAASGLTNRAIAQRLHLSPKTVDAHLGRVFGKLGVRSRVELATLVSQGNT
jgi:DNA-binding CsgD family transcriptional regulator/tetratricopeptide (TPR) repeat protein